MSEAIYVGDRKICTDCLYSRVSPSTEGGRYMKYCGYISDAGHSRVWENGKRIVEKGYCNKFESKRRKNNDKDKAFL